MIFTTAPRVSYVPTRLDGVFFMSVVLSGLSRSYRLLVFREMMIHSCLENMFSTLPRQG